MKKKEKKLTVLSGCLLRLLATINPPPAMPPVILLFPVALLVITRPEFIAPGIDIAGLFVPAILFIEDCNPPIEFAIDIELLASELAMLLGKFPITICWSTTPFETETFGGDCIFGLLLPKVPAAIANELATKFLLPCEKNHRLFVNLFIA